LSEQSQGFSNLKAYAAIQHSTGNELSPELEQMLKSVENCKNSDFAQFVQEHSASIMRKVMENDAAAANKKSDFMRHYKLVNRIGGVELDS
jgi:hypothetical protein